MGVWVYSRLYISLHTRVYPALKQEVDITAFVCHTGGTRKTGGCSFGMATRKKSKTKKKSRSTEDDRSVTYEEAMYNLLCKVYGPPTSLIQKPKTAAQKKREQAARKKTMDDRKLEHWRVSELF